MKSVLIFLILFGGFSLFGQIESMRKMGETTFEANGYIFPLKENDFQVTKGMRFNFTLIVKNEGDDKYQLRKEKFIEATVSIKGKETPLTIKLEPYTQVQLRDGMIKTLQARKEKISQFSNVESAEYIAKIFGKFGVKDKVAALKYIDTEIEKCTVAKVAGAKFDEDRTVLPGAELYLSGFGYLSEADYPKDENFVNVNLKYVGDEERHINIPLKAQFY